MPDRSIITQRVSEFKKKTTYIKIAKYFCNFDPHLAFHYIGGTPNNFSVSVAVQNMLPNSDHAHNEHN